MQKLTKAHEKKCKYVFFDIFDTIVERTINPEHTKKLWANYMVKRLNLNMSITELYTLRNKLEYELGENNCKKGVDWEFAYSELTEALYKNIKPTQSQKEFEEIAEDIEVEVERNVQTTFKDIVDEIKKLKKEGKKIYCISDMYLSKNMIEKIFEKHGILDLFEYIYVSCEYHKSKKSGNLYDLVLKELKVKPEECTMVGDNKHSDYEMPLSKGLEAIHLDRTENYEKYAEYAKKHTEENVNEAFKILSKSTTNNFEHAIFTLYSFIEKLYYSLLREGKDEVFFLSREGEYLKKLFDAYVEKINYKKIKSHYLLVSRKATFLPSLNKIEDEDFGRLLKQYSYTSIVEFMKSLNFPQEEIDSILNSVKNDYKKNKIKLTEKESEEIKELNKGNFDVKISNTYTSNIIKILISNKEFKEVYEKNRKEQNKLFKQYICEMTDSKEICVVDIGWNGSIQDNIQYILGDKYKVNGYLYGLVSRDPANCKNDKEGLIFSNVPEQSPNFDLFFENRTIFEVLLGASHGSANKYALKDGKVEVLLFNKQEERDIYDNIISKIQDDMFTIYNELLELFVNGYYDNRIIDKKINEIHYKMVFKPSKDQLQFFNKIYHYENFGVFEFSEFKAKKKLGLKYYIKENIKYFIRHKQFFWDTFWPVQKLSNEKLYLQKFLYTTKVKLKLKMRRLI